MSAKYKYESSYLDTVKYSVSVVELIMISGGWGVGGGGGRGCWVNFCWVYAAGLLEPIPHYSLIIAWPVIDPILVTYV